MSLNIISKAKDTYKSSENDITINVQPNKSVDENKNETKLMTLLHHVQPMSKTMLSNKTVNENKCELRALRAPMLHEFLSVLLTEFSPQLLKIHAKTIDSKHEDIIKSAIMNNKDDKSEPKSKNNYRAL